LHVLELFTGAGCGVGEVELPQFLYVFGERLVAKSDVAQNAVHGAILLKFAEGFGDELEGQLGDQRDLLLLLVLDLLLQVEFLLKEGAQHLLLHLQIPRLLLVLFVDLALDILLAGRVLELARASSSSMRCL
jgi:hypothetical protein